jgi:translation initiation factor 2 beta subunit (eIF-2beta)/eIF-5
MAQKCFKKKHFSRVIKTYVQDYVYVPMCENMPFTMRSNSTVLEQLLI